MFNILTGRDSEKKTFVKSDVCIAYQTLEGKKESYTSGVKGTDTYKQVLAFANHQYKDIDISWLPAAAETYQISADIRDYVITDVPAVTVDIPNRNLQAFPFEEISYFDRQFGKMIYKTFIGKPSCKDHDNDTDENPDRAKGVIFHSSLQYIPEYGIYKIRLLQGWDRTKDEKLCHDILSGKRPYYSMGALASSFLCPICGQIKNSQRPCPCSAQGNGSEYMGHLQYSLCIGVNFIENSNVEEPADFAAEGKIM